MNTDALPNVDAVFVPEGSLAVLAPLRCRKDVRITPVPGGLWVTWEPKAAEEVLPILLPARGSLLYVQQEGKWYPLGSRLPDVTLPPKEESFGPERVVHPAPIREIAPGTLQFRTIPWRLARSSHPQPASALRGNAEILRLWGESVPSVEIFGLRAAVSGADIVILGENIPLISETKRFWGDRVLQPMGMISEPALPESFLRGAAGIEESELLILDETGLEAIPFEAFQPLTRRGLRRLHG